MNKITSAFKGLKHIWAHTESHLYYQGNLYHEGETAGNSANGKVQITSIYYRVH